MNIWQFQNKLSRRLLAWSAISIVSGFFLLRGNKFWKGVGWQFIGWGAIDAMIALFGNASANQRIDNMDNPGDTTIQEKEADNLQKILWVNTGLDVLYMLGGKNWSDKDKGDGSRAGHGLGIALQGLFLLIFDVWHALAVPKKDTPK
jgi:hypothetical protein